MAVKDALLMEIDQEAATTRRVLERVPEDRLTWKPHAKSMSLGQLALHVAQIPGQIAGFATQHTSEIQPGQAEAKTRTEVLEAHDKSLSDAKAMLGGFSDEDAMSNWTATMGGSELLTIPKVALLRSIMLNHWYHHRGQLSVYLRLLDVPVPSIYGPSADENPFAT